MVWVSAERLLDVSISGRGIYQQAISRCLILHLIALSGDSSVAEGSVLETHEYCLPVSYFSLAFSCQRMELLADAYEVPSCC